MSVEDWLSILVIVLCLGLSFFFSGSETALTAFSRARMLRLEKTGNRRAALVNRLLDARERLIGAILTGNNVVNIAASSLTTGLLLSWFGDVGVLYATMVMTVAIVVFTEVLPKTVAINAPDRVALLVARPISWIVRLLGPMLVGIEAVVHYACRDRNLLGMLSDLLGAAAAGLNNLLIVTGDPPKMGPYPDATAVFDIDAIGLTNLVARLNRGLDPGGNPLGGTTRFLIAVGANPTAADRDRELELPERVVGEPAIAVRQRVAGIDLERARVVGDRADVLVQYSVGVAAIVVRQRQIGPRLPAALYEARARRDTRRGIGRSPLAEPPICRLVGGSRAHRSPAQQQCRDRPRASHGTSPRGSWCLGTWFCSRRATKCPPIAG